MTKESTAVYITDEEGVFLFPGLVPSDELTEHMATVPPPICGISDPNEYVWKDGQWNARLSENGKISLWSEIRTKRNQLLSECDWTQVADADITKEFKSKMKAYRQELRDLSDKYYDDPRELVWPELPTE